MNPLRLVLALVGAAVVSACASTSFSGEGGDRRFYEARCGVCHVPFPREEHDAAEWPKILDVMAPRAGLTSSQRRRVLSYLTDAPVVSSSVEGGAAGAAPR